jgi:glucose-6-phosphate 1-dehydrogenase
MWAPAATVEGMDAPRTLVILGASGDLAGRLLLPALATLAAGPSTDDSSTESYSQLSIVGGGREAWDDEAFRGHIARWLTTRLPGLRREARDSLLARLRYQQVDVGDAASVAALLERVPRPAQLSIYLALPTEQMPTAVGALGEAGLAPGTRIAVEKPFGQDAASARELNAQLVRAVGDGGAYRVDHVMAMEIVQLLAPQARARVSLEWLRGAADVERIEILWEETLALEGRAAFYDRAGALRDVIQNHLLQILCAIAIEPDLTARHDPGAARLAVLEAVQPWDGRSSRRGRYTAGQLSRTAQDSRTDSAAVPDYLGEDGVDPRRMTETFAEVTLQIDTPRWAGVPFVLRAGKALSQRRRGVLLHRRDGDTEGAQSLWLDADEPNLGVARPPAFQEDSAPGAGGDAEIGAYTAVLNDLLSGGTNLSVSGPEAEAAWAALAPTLSEWAANRVPIVDYPAGSTGPIGRPSR